MFQIRIRYVETSTAKHTAKRITVRDEVIFKPTKAKAWKLVCDTQRKAAHTTTVALLDIIVLDNDGTQLWSLR